MNAQSPITADAEASTDLALKLVASNILAGRYPQDDEAFETVDWIDAAEAVRDETPGALADLLTMLKKADAYPAFLDWRSSGPWGNDERYLVDFSEWLDARKHWNWEPFSCCQWSAAA